MASTASETSGSSAERRCGPCCTMATRLPNLRNAWPSSTPMNPPPRIRRWSGSEFSSSAVSLVSGLASSRPETEGIPGFAPRLMNSFSPKSRRGGPPSAGHRSTVRGATNRASPRMKRSPSDPCRLLQLRSTIPDTTARLWASTPARSVFQSPTWTPNWAARDVRSATLAFVGMQPTLMHVPPIMPRSISATRWPARARSEARVLPAFPPPTISTS